MSRTYKLITRQDFIDDQGNGLSLVLDSNGFSWHLWGEYTTTEGRVAHWLGSWMPTLENGKAELERRTTELLEWGWHRTAS